MTDYLVSHLGRLALDDEEADMEDLVYKFTMQIIVRLGYQFNRLF